MSDHQYLKDIIQKNRIALFMKGNATQPMCGFSATVVQILHHLGQPFEAYNVLEDDNLRQDIKDFSDWPTIPQLYVDGQFIGGCDIVKEMFQSGELQQLLGIEKSQEA